MESCISKIMDIQVKSYFERKNKFMKKIKYVIALCLGMMLLFGNALSCFAATESGTYPTRKGTILVTPDAYKNLIPTGHAAFLDKYNVNLNTSAYKTPLGNPIHPMEIVNSSNTYTFYQYKK